MNIMQVLAKFADGVDSHIREVTALRKHNIPQAWRYFNDLLNRTIREPNTACKVQDPKVLKRLVWWQAEECRICNQVAVCETELAKAPAIL